MYLSSKTLIVPVSSASWPLAKEGPLINDDLELKTHYSFSTSASHSSTLTSLFLEEAAARHPTVSFVHDFPWCREDGTLDRGISILDEMDARAHNHSGHDAIHGLVAGGRANGWCSLLPAQDIPPRQVAGGSKSAGVPLSDGVEVAKGAHKEAGADLLDWNSEETEGKIMAKYRKEGMRKQVWDHTYEVIGRDRGTWQGKL